MLILCTHGTNGTPGIADAHATTIRGRRIFADVFTCCIKGTPTLSETLARRGPGPSVIVPTLMADGVIARQIGAVDTSFGDGSRSVHVSSPMGEEIGMTNILTARARAACGEINAAARQTTLLVVGHGTPRDPASARTLLAHAARLESEAVFNAVQCAFLDQSPTIVESLATAQPGPVVVIGFFADHGAHGDGDMNKFLSDNERTTHYAGPIGAAPEIVDLIIDLARKSCS